MAGNLVKVTKNKNSKDSKDGKEIEDVKESVMKRIRTVDKLSNIIENTLDEADVLGNPLTLAPGSVGYEDTIELYIKLIRANKDLVESFRKLKLTEFELRDREQKIVLRNAFIKTIEGKSLEEIKSLVREGKFGPTNMVAGTLFGSAVVDGDSNAARAIMQGLTDWGSEDEFTDSAPILTVNLNLSEKEKDKMRSAGQAIPETIDIIPEE
jgi:hypothetical protein